MLKKNLVLFFIFMPFSGYCVDNCLRFQYDVDVNVEQAEDVVEIEKSSENLSGELGHTLSNRSCNYNMLFINVRVPDGYCVSLRSINMKINQNFNIVLDKRLKEGSCAYNLVMKHEKDHMNVTKKVLDDNMDNIKNALKKSMKNLYPVFVENTEKNNDIESVIVEKIENSKFMKKIKEQVENETQKESNNIDTRGDDYELWRCKDYMKEMEEFYK